jgi:hypothetical protein
MRLVLHGTGSSTWRVVQFNVIQSNVPGRAGLAEDRVEDQLGTKD